MSETLSSLRQQHGAIDLVAIFALMFAIVAGIAVFRIFPLYLDHWSLEEAMRASIEEAAQDRKPSKRKVTQLLTRRFQVNRIEFVSAQDIELDRTTTTLGASLAYERRAPLLFNIDVVLVFDETYAEAELASQ